MNWYARINGQEYGPVTVQQLQQWAMESRILATTEVRQGETGTWVLAGQVQGLMPPPQQIPTQQIPQAQSLGSSPFPASNSDAPMIVTKSPRKNRSSRSTRRRGRSSKYYNLSGASLGCLFFAIGFPLLCLFFIANGNDPEYSVSEAVPDAVLVGILLPIYFLPTIIAIYRQHLNWVPLAIIQTLLGWTVIAWCICLAWSFSGNVDSRNPRMR